ncbi:MAG: PilZ domain-containing protein [Novosphingobium sp.]|nr:PilZ domain-containing protein [Novosphingobium sp.]
MPERRRELRVPTRSRAVLMLSPDETIEVELADISMHGCCIKASAAGLRIGRFISIGIDGNPMLQAVIRWVRDGAAGMEFVRPIPSERIEWHALIETPF